MGCMTDIQSLYRAYEESWASQDWNAWMATLSPDYQFRIGDRVIGGREETLAWSEALFAFLITPRRSCPRMSTRGPER